MTENKKRFIIGGGMTGLIFAYYNPNCYIINEPPKERLESESAFTFINDTKYNRELLDDLSIPYEKHPVKITSKTSPDKILSNKIGQPSPCDFKIIGSDRLSAIGEGLILYVLNVPVSIVKEALERSIGEERFIYGRAVEISSDKIFYIPAGSIERAQPLYYDEVISTIHFRAFEKIYYGWDSGPDIKEFAFRYREVKEDIKSSEIIYGYDDKIHRRILNAITGTRGDEISDSEWVRGDSSVEILRGRKIKGKINPPPKGCVFIGRFATANSKWRYDDSVFVAKYGFILSRILAEQKRFDSAVKQKSGNESLDERIKSLVLHAHSELTELLREVSWKDNKPKEQVIKRTSILEESIDVIRLILAILHEFNYSEKEIYEMFLSKTKITWDKLLDDFFGGL